MPASSPPLHWDIFCHVIDNYGDVGVCWRLARQLAGKYDFTVRLWIDNLAVFQQLCPAVRQDQSKQIVERIEVRLWPIDFTGIEPGDIVVESFACQLPECFERAMAERQPSPVWINLDYLSAEPWVSEYHKLPSPHPQLPLVKYFFFPGFSEATGGLLRENDLIERWQTFAEQTSMRDQFLATLGITLPSSDTLMVSLFSYENPTLADLLNAWAGGDRAICCLSALTTQQADLEQFFGQTLHTGDTVRKGCLEMKIIPFVSQADYDKLLWSCDINFVRGEDSFVRAQWAAHPMIWQIYPQNENAHHVKLSAFLDLYGAGLPEATAQTIRTFFRAWNGDGRITRELCGRWLDELPELRLHAGAWQKKLLEQQDLCRQLVQFARSKL